MNLKDIFMPKSELVKFEGDTLTFSDAKITSVTLSENGGTINVTGHQDIYGLIYLTYNLTLNPNIVTQGAFTGKALGYGENGERNTASLGGVWELRRNEAPSCRCRLCSCTLLALCIIHVWRPPSGV